MANLIPENIQTLLSTYTFDLDYDSMNEDLTCIICKNLLHDAYQNICDCKYCRKCIVSYMSGGNEYCPGGKEKCRDEQLVIDETVFSNSVLNKKVLKVKVCCPNESCQFTSTLTQMEDHLRVCSHQPIECPYTKIGCGNVRFNRDSVENHFNREALAHSQMLIEVVDNLKNDVKGLKEELRANKLEMASLREEFKLKEEIRKEERRMVQEEKEALTAKEPELKGEVAATRWQMECSEKEEAAGIIDGRIKKLTEAVESLNLRMNERVVVGSLWFKVVGFDELRKKEETIFSPHLYSHLNGYKLRIRVDLSSEFGRCLCVSSIICQGEYDDVLSWPANGLSVSVSLINHRTKEAYDTGIIKYCNQYCNKPIDKNNKPYGGIWIVSFSSLTSTAGLIVSDSILLFVTARPP